VPCALFPSAHSLPSNTRTQSSSLTQTILTIMSQTHPTTASSSSSSSNFQLMINTALNKYKQRTKKDLREHPLAAQLQSCDSPSAIILVLQQQLQGLDQSRSADERWTKWMDPTVNVLYTFSSVLGSGVSMVCLRTCTCLRSALSYFVPAILPCKRHIRWVRHPSFSV
jgi:fungal STAND N-terminal Goodbye domain